MKTTPSQFELALLAMTLDGQHAPSERVKLAMDVWEEAGETLFPAPMTRVAVTLEQMMEKLLPVVGNGKKKLTIKAIKTARMSKYRRFVEWCEWAAWGPDFVRGVLNESTGTTDMIPVTKAFVGERVKATIKAQVKEGILDTERVEEDFRYFFATEKLRLDAIYSERARKGAAATHSKQSASKSPGSAATVTKRRVPRKTSPRRKQPKIR